LARNILYIQGTHSGTDLNKPGAADVLINRQMLRSAGLVASIITMVYHLTFNVCKLTNSFDCDIHLRTKLVRDREATTMVFVQYEILEISGDVR
jgi:hypothetical protein